jgi:Fic family protein
MARTTGTFERSTVAGEAVEAFIPHPLPPTDPPLDLEGELGPLLARANESIRMLELAGDLVPSVEWFVYAFVRKEAVLSAQIEGTQATLMDLLEVEASGDAPVDAHVEEICGYVDALNFSWRHLGSPDGLPLSMRLLSETHARLLSGARGAQKQPGEARRSQNWIGGTRPGNAAFVPPPPHRLGELLRDFERAIHNESELPPLVRVGLLHVQFETLHPYLDGNGRLGRLLITLLLKQWGLLTRPLLYLSLFLKMHRREYYARLSGVREEGDWEGWLAFFLEGVATVGDEAVATARRLHVIVGEKRAAPGAGGRNGVQPQALRTPAGAPAPHREPGDGAPGLLPARCGQGAPCAGSRGHPEPAGPAQEEPHLGVRGLPGPPAAGDGVGGVT